MAARGDDRKPWLAVSLASFSAWLVSLICTGLFFVIGMIVVLAGSDVQGVTDDLQDAETFSEFTDAIADVAAGVLAVMGLSTLVWLLTTAALLKLFSRLFGRWRVGFGKALAAVLVGSVAGIAASFLDALLVVSLGLLGLATYLAVSTWMTLRLGRPEA